MTCSEITTAKTNAQNATAGLQATANTTQAAVIAALAAKMLADTEYTDAVSANTTAQMALTTNLGTIQYLNDLYTYQGC